MRLKRNRTKNKVAPYNGSELRDNGNNRNQDVAPAVATVVPGGRSPYDF